MKIRRAVLLVLLLTAAALAQQAGPQNSITSLYDSFGAQKAGTVYDWGFAALVRYNGKTILFDTGNDPQTLEHNAKALGIDLTGVDLVVLSHAHNDHAAGFPYFLRVNRKAKIFLPDDHTFLAGVFVPSKQAPSTAGEERTFAGVTFRGVKPAGMFAGTQAVPVEKSIEISPGIFLIHTSSRLVGTVSGYPPDSPEKPHFEGLPELSLALKTPQGIVLISGCSHSEIETIVIATRKFTGIDIALVEGGFHLLPYPPEYVTALARRLKDELGVRRIAPNHCTGQKAMAIFRQVYGENYVDAGIESVVKF